MGKLLITSGGYIDGQRGEKLDKKIEKLSKDKKVLIITNATATGSNVKGVSVLQTNFGKIAKKVEVLHLTEENVEQIHDYDVLYFTGGDTAPLIEMATEKVKSELVEYLLGNTLVVGESAGSIIFGEDLKWYYDVKKGTKPKYDVELPTYRGLGLIDYTIYPHWNKASKEQKQKVKDYAKEHKVKIKPLKDGEFYEHTEKEIINSNNILC